MRSFLTMLLGVILLGMGLLTVAMVNPTLMWISLVVIGVVVLLAGHYLIWGRHALDLNENSQEEEVWPEPPLIQESYSYLVGDEWLDENV